MNEILPPKPPLKPKPGGVKVYRAKFSYAAQNDDELSVEEGDLLSAVENQSFEDWMLVRRIGEVGREGLVPRAYVLGGESEEVREHLHDAARRGNLMWIEQCISHGVSLTHLDAAGNTLLHCATHAQHLHVVEYVLNKINGVTIDILNAKNQFGDTALHLAASRGNIDCVNLLLAAGADAGVQNCQGETPLCLAANNAVKNVIQMHLAKSKNNTFDEDYGDDCEDDDDEDNNTV